MFGLFKKFKDGLTKTAQKLVASVGGLFGQKPIDAATLDQLEEALYGADFGVETTAEILEEIRAAYKKDKNLHGQEAAAIGAAVLRRVLAGSEGTLGVITKAVLKLHPGVAGANAALVAVPDFAAS